MRWPDEPYVRIYKRDTTELCLLSWQARALLWELLRKVDLSGFVAVGKAGTRGLALLVRMPPDVVELALRGEDGLLADGCVVEVDGGLALPNYVEAQQARSSDKLRKQEQRSRDAADRLRSARPVTSGDETGRAVTPGDETGHLVTQRDGQSQNVTDSHTRSPAVTAGHSEQSRAEQSKDRERAEAELGPDQSSPQAAPTPEGEPKAHKPDRKRPATRQPADGIVADWLHGWGIPQTQDPTWGSEVQKFLDWHAAKDSRFVDWSAAWRTWRAKAAEFGRGPSAPLPPRGSRPVQRSPEYQPTEERKRAEFIAENARKQRELGLVPDEHGQVF
jgi:hypothetical protein